MLPLHLDRRNRHHAEIVQPSPRRDRAIDRFEPAPDFNNGSDDLLVHSLTAKGWVNIILRVFIEELPAMAAIASFIALIFIICILVAGGH